MDLRGSRVSALKITVKLSAQVRAALGEISELECAPGCTAAQALHLLAERNEESAAFPLDACMLFVNGEQLARRETRVLNTGDELTVLAPISGG